MRSAKIPIIEYMRGTASLVVAWFHLTNSYDGNWVESTGALGWLGVEVFFVISGFIIPYSIAQTYETYELRDFPHFFLQRIARIEPPYVVSIALVLVLGYLSELAPAFRGAAPSFDFEQIAAHLFYFIPLTSLPWLQPVYWTLAYEFVFYLFIGLTFPFIAGNRKSAVWRIYATFVSIAVLSGLLSDLWLLFVIGIMVFRRAVLSDTWTGTTIGLSALLIAYHGSCRIAVAGMLTAAFILWGRSVVIPGFVGRLLTSAGTLSYSLYLVHIPIGGRIINLGKRFIEHPVGELGLSVFALAISIACAAVFRLGIERPAISFARRLLVQSVRQ